MSRARGHGAFLVALAVLLSALPLAAQPARDAAPRLASSDP